MCAAVSAAVKSEPHCVLLRHLRNDIITGKNYPIVATQVSLWPLLRVDGLQGRNRLFWKKGSHKRADAC